MKNDLRVHVVGLAQQAQYNPCLMTSGQHKKGLAKAGLEPSVCPPEPDGVCGRATVAGRSKVVDSQRPLLEAQFDGRNPARDRSLLCLFKPLHAFPAFV